MLIRTTKHLSADGTRPEQVSAQVYILNVLLSLVSIPQIVLHLIIYKVYINAADLRTANAS